MSTPKWLENAVIYNIYPQSFYDSNGDGIGDLNGVCQKLDFIENMGYTAIWLNPVYASPFGDAGYDVADFYKIAPRYGTNEDFAYLCSEAKKRNIRVLMDLVAGHTSTECEWFKCSAEPTRNEYSDRYIWTDSVWKIGKEGEYVRGFSSRDGCYLTNFFYCQPALNYGYQNVEEPWQLPTDHPACLAMRDELLKIMDFWCDLGASGFRVDMASSLIKNDPDGKGIYDLWQYLSKKFKANHPDGILISEWFNPKKAIPAGFDIDFFAQGGEKAYTTLFRYEPGTNQSDLWSGKSYFRPEGEGNFKEFLDTYMEQYNATKDKGFISMPTGNHDVQRISMLRDVVDLKIAYTFLLTMPGVPFVYYGDEIGMEYIKNLPSKEGGFNRTGTRTPMQWGSGKNLGFSTNDTTYLPVDDSASAPTVEAQLKDDDSLLNYTKGLIALRKAEADLYASEGIEFISTTGYPLVIKRGSITMVINPKDAPCEVKVDAINVLQGVNAMLENGIVKMTGKGAIIVK